MAQVLFTKYLDSLFKNEGLPIQTHCVHPGIVNTDLFNDTNLKKFVPVIPALLFKVNMKYIDDETALFL